MSARPARLRVIGDPTPGPHRTDSDDIGWWLPILGPTSSWLAYLLARHATTEPDTCWDIATLAHMLGLVGNQSKLWASFERLQMFGAAQFLATDVLTLRLWLPALTDRRLDKLPPPLADAYRHHHQDL